MSELFQISLKITVARLRGMLYHNIMSTESLPQAFTPHDHRRCQETALAEIADVCRSRNLRLTPARSCVLKALLREHRALTAYELLEFLRREKLGSQPPVAYRALDFLVANGFVHRLEKLSAFIACTHISNDHAAAFLICRECRRVAETEIGSLTKNIAATADRHAFQVERVVLEVEGLCEACRKDET